MDKHRWPFSLLVGFLLVLNFCPNSVNAVGHANTTRLCRHNCRLSSLPFSSTFVVPSQCGQLNSFYGCRVEIEINYTRHSFNIHFTAYTEQSFEMLQVDYDYSVDLALDLAFYRNIFTTTVIFTCLTEDQCTDEYVSIAVKQLIDSESILHELLPIYLDRSLDNRTITCQNTIKDDISCYGGYCKSISIEKDTLWSFEDCEYPSELSVLSSTELTSLTAFFIAFEPENQDDDQVNTKRITLICNVDFCNGEETMEKGKSILNRFNQAAFNFHPNQTTTITTSSQPSKTSTTSLSTTTSTTGEILPDSSRIVMKSPYSRFRASTVAHRFDCAWSHPRHCPNPCLYPCLSQLQQMKTNTQTLE